MQVALLPCGGQLLDAQLDYYCFHSLCCRRSGNAASLFQELHDNSGIFAFGLFQQFPACRKMAENCLNRCLAS
jgi:hypothetical protein